MKVACKCVMVGPTRDVLAHVVGEATTKVLRFHYVAIVLLELPIINNWILSLIYVDSYFSNQHLLPNDCTL